MIVIQRQKNRRMYIKTKYGERGYATLPQINRLIREDKNFKILDYDGRDMTYELMLRMIEQNEDIENRPLSTLQKKSFQAMTRELIRRGLTLTDRVKELE